MPTGSHLKVKSMGENVQGVEIKGNKSQPEHASFRVAFPGGDVDISRTSDGDYWIHVRVNHYDGASFDPESPEARITDARLDVIGKHVNETDSGDFANDGLYHMAVKVSRK